MQSTSVLWATFRYDKISKKSVLMITTTGKPRNKNGQIKPSEAQQLTINGVSFEYRGHPITPIRKAILEILLTPGVHSVDAFLHLFDQHEKAASQLLYKYIHAISKAVSLTIKSGAKQPGAYFNTGYWCLDVYEPEPWELMSPFAREIYCDIKEEGWVSKDQILQNVRDEDPSETSSVIKNRMKRYLVEIRRSGYKLRLINGGYQIV